MKSKEELNALKEEVETVSRKLRELTEEELERVNGGVLPNVCFGFDVEKGVQLDPAGGEKYYQPSGIIGSLDDEAGGLLEHP